MYVIGGVVDRNRLPGVCAERAKKLGITQKRLPIKENITVSSDFPTEKIFYSSF